MKLTFVYLIKQDDTTWNEFSTSISLLEKKILRKLTCNYDILLFTEGSPNRNALKTINYLSEEKKINIINKLISLRKYVSRSGDETYEEKFPHPVVCDLYTSLGYRDMCKFFTFDVFNDENLGKTDYLIRVDTDSFFLDVRPNFIKDLNNLDCDYGYLLDTEQVEDKAVSLGFGNCLYDYCQKSAKESLPDNYFDICNDATSKPKIFYTNFEVVNLNWIKSKESQKLLNYIINSEGIYRRRWGDALIRYYSVKLLNANKKVLSGCLYKHSGIYDSRSKLRQLVGKVFSKLTNNSHKNTYEKGFKFYETIFLGIRNN